MSGGRFTSSRTDGWNRPRATQDASVRHLTHGRIQPMAVHQSFGDRVLRVAICGGALAVMVGIAWFAARWVGLV